MNDSRFPPEIPKMGDLVRVTPEKIDYVVKHYKDFCEEAYVASRFSGIDYEGNLILQISLSGRVLIEPLRFNPIKQMWLTFFDGYDRIVKVETLLE